MAKNLIAAADAALVILQNFYPHEIQKRHQYHFLPIMAITSLRQELVTGAIGVDEFNARMFQVFAQLRDNHTRYRVDRSFYSSRNMDHDIGPYRIPCLIEKAHNKRGKPLYVVSHIDSAPAVVLIEGFEVGVRVTHWNDVPIEEAVRINAANFWGATREAYLAQGLKYLTLRPTDLSVPPAEDRVRIRFVANGQNSASEQMFDWMKIGSKIGATIPVGLESSESASIGLDEVAYQAQQVNREYLIAGFANYLQPVRDRDNYSLANYIYKGRTISYMRLWNFNVPKPTKFIKDLVADLERLPRGGLVIDLRGNPGGMIKAAELMLQLFTPNSIHPTRFQFANSEAVREMLRSSKYFRDWRRNDDESTTAESHSVARPLYSEKRINTIGQVYTGPVVLVVDALTYSAADMFAASFQDHGIGEIIGVDKRTGGGGSNVWSWDQYRAIVPDELLGVEKEVRSKMKLLIRSGGRELKNELRRWIFNGVPEDLRDQVVRVIGPLTIENRYLLWLVKNEEQELLLKALYVPWLSDSVHLLRADRELPQGIKIPFSIRRSLRQGEQSGMVLEDFGVRADYLHRPTIDDVVCSNQDLLNYAAQKLLTKPPRVLYPYTASASKFSLLVRGVRKVVIFEDGVPTQSLGDLPISPRIKRFVLHEDTKRVSFVGYDGADVVVSKKLTVKALRSRSLD